MPDPFSTLPLPLPLLILNGLEDLGTLHYPLQASPTVNVIFAQHYCEITDSILSNFVPQLRKLLRIVVFIRSRPSSIREQCASFPEYETFRANEILGEKAGTTLLHKSQTTLAAVRSLAKTASQLQSLRVSFFEVHIDRVNTIEPYRLLKHPTRREDLDANIPGPDVTRYEIVECTEPSWIEEQRVLRALWRLVVYFDLCEVSVGPTAIDKVDGLWSGTCDDNGDNIASLPDYALQEIDCVLKFLMDLSNVTGEPRMLQGLPVPAIDSFTIPKPTPFFDELAEHRSQLPPSLDEPSPGFHFFRGCMELRQRCPGPGSGFERFRYLGLGIWDREKLSRLGLKGVLPDIQKKYQLPSYELCPGIRDLTVRWRSVIVNRSSGIGHR
ncbi:MAG: hypothetical protein LQ350_002282 [Teloschistes chrysophthalmus]|nr:MAG: hypothetical protein LQ350_002282 [Niorma chrysophthalma]